MYPVDYAFICEIGHFFIAFCVGLSAYYLTFHTFWHPMMAERDTSRLLCGSLLLGASAALLSHLALDSWGAV